MWQLGLEKRQAAAVQEQTYQEQLQVMQKQRLRHAQNQEYEEFGQQYDQQRAFQGSVPQRPTGLREAEQRERRKRELQVAIPSMAMPRHAFADTDLGWH